MVTDDALVNAGSGGRVSDPVVLDGGDRRCVRLLIELLPPQWGCAPGTIIHLITTDPAATIDLPAWCHMTGHAYLGRVAGPGRPTFAVRVDAAAKATRADAPWHIADD